MGLLVCPSCCWNFCNILSKFLFHQTLLLTPWIFFWIQNFDQFESKTLDIQLSGYSEIKSKLFFKVKVWLEFPKNFSQFVHASVYEALSVDWSIDLSVSSSVCLSIHLSVSLSVHPMQIFSSVHATLKVTLSVHLSGGWSVRLLVFYAVQYQAKKLSNLQQCPCPSLPSWCCQVYGLVFHRKIWVEMAVNNLQYTCQLSAANNLQSSFCLFSTFSSLNLFLLCLKSKFKELPVNFLSKAEKKNSWTFLLFCLNFKMHLSTVHWSICWSVCQSIGQSWFF